MTLDAANNNLSLSGVALRMTQKGMAIIAEANKGFIHALEFCSKNSQAKQHVLKMLSDYKDNSELIYLHSQGNGAPSDSNVMPVIPADTPVTQNLPAQEPVHQEVDRSAPEHQTHHSSHDENVPATTGGREFVGHHVYGGSGALYLSLDTTKNGANTIAIDGTKGANKQFNWKEKVRMQITRGDLPSVAAVFFGLVLECELSNYGADNTKRLTLKNQGKNFFLNMSAKGSAQIAVPIMASDVFEIRALFLRQLLANSPEIGVDGVLANLKCHAVMLNQK